MNAEAARRTRNPYGVGKGRPSAWNRGYAADRDGLTKQHNPYRMEGVSRAWLEGFKASEQDRKAGIA